MPEGHEGQLCEWPKLEDSLLATIGTEVVAARNAAGEVVDNRRAQAVETCADFALWAAQALGPVFDWYDNCIARGVERHDCVIDSTTARYNHMSGALQQLRNRIEERSHYGR